MPAKEKYLSSGWSRFSKVTAAILGGYLVTMLIHIAAAKIPEDDTNLIITTAYSSFLMWVGFMILAFFIKKAWQVWTLYSLIGLCCAALIFLL